MGDGILNYSIAATPIAVIDFETTGLSADRDRALEVSVVRVEPGGATRKLTFDTLVNPRRPVAATEIHGITDSMVEKAPDFSAIWPALRSALSGCVVAAYNAYFDMRFLAAESERVGDIAQPPYFCLMYVRSLIGIGTRCRLDDACKLHGVALHDAHRSARDAMATAELIPAYLEAMEAQGLNTFADLREAGSHKYLRSFELDPLRPPRRPSHCPLFTRDEIHVRRNGLLGLLTRRRTTTSMTGTGRTGRSAPD